MSNINTVNQTVVKYQVSNGVYRRRSEQVEAVQWYKNGDHPEDQSVLIRVPGTPPFFSEGKVVRRFRRPDVSGSTSCKYCRAIFHIHGWIDDGAHGQVVCPGDYVVKGQDGTFTAWKPSLFKETFEEVLQRPPSRNESWP